MTARIRVALVGGLSLSLGAWLGACSPQRAQSRGLEAGTEKNAPETLAYTVRGEVRFLLFWMGRDNVGGGRISLASGSERASEGRWEDVEIRFGSNPERVPGNVNLWGYAKERSHWRQDAGGQRELVHTVFEGFIRPRDQSTSRPGTVSNAGPAERSYRYKAIHSDVTSTDATSEIRYFVENEDADYRTPEGPLRGLRESISTAPPETKNGLLRGAGTYDAPYGFLSALKNLVGQITTAATLDSNGWTTVTPSVRYVHQANPYRLLVRKIRRVEGPLRPPSEHDNGRRELADVDFRIENLSDEVGYDFTLSFPLQGPMQGLPVRVAYQPRWWLRLTMDLESD